MDDSDDSRSVSHSASGRLAGRVALSSAAGGERPKGKLSERIEIRAATATSSSCDDSLQDESRLLQTQQ